MKFKKKQEIKKPPEVKTKEVFSMQDSIELQKQGWVIVSIKSAQGVNLKTWTLKKG